MSLGLLTWYFVKWTGALFVKTLGDVFKESVSLTVLVEQIACVIG